MPAANSYVLDASALLALLNDEKGAETVQGLLPEAVISSVNLAEVVARLSSAGMPENDIRDVLALLGLEVVSFDNEQAYLAGLLVSHGRKYGLSLGDRACLALARSVTATAVTADRAWVALDVGINIKTIR
jgi:PIN domain nuclease of toxin-antitoxin system